MICWPTLPALPLKAVTERLSPSASVSLARTLPSRVLPSVALKASAWPTGASLTSLTVTLTVALALPPWPSEIV